MRNEREKKAHTEIISLKRYKCVWVHMKYSDANEIEKKLISCRCSCIINAYAKRKGKKCDSQIHCNSHGLKRAFRVFLAYLIEVARTSPKEPSTANSAAIIFFSSLCSFGWLKAKLRKQRKTCNHRTHTHTSPGTATEKVIQNTCHSAMNRANLTANSSQKICLINVE